MVTLVCTFIFLDILVVNKPKLFIVDPLQEWQEYLNKLLYGDRIYTDEIENTKPDEGVGVTANFMEEQVIDKLDHYPSGKLFRSELFQNYSAVHLPFPENMFKGHSRLLITPDLMQTAVNAFAIIAEGTLDDLLAMPSEYLLLSSRAISMMKLKQEKFAAIWTVVKGSRKTSEIEIDTLELFRPLFKYVSGKEISRLNLLDKSIIKFIGTHPDLNRLQVGVVASKYMQLNPKWMEARYLNMMNNLLCGVPMTFMRRIPEHTYLQLSQQALGKSYSWSPNDVARLGFLLTEVESSALSSITPESMTGISSRVMHAMPAANLLHFTEQQISYLSSKPYNIYRTKLKEYKEYQDQFNHSHSIKPFMDYWEIIIYAICMIFSKICFQGP